MGNCSNAPLTRGQIRGYLEAYRQKAQAEKRASKKYKRRRR